MPVIQEQIQIINKLGLHARAAAKLVGVASAFGSDIHLGYEGKMVDAKSIMSVMMLAASKGTTLLIKIEGNDAEQAMAAISELVANRFDEPE